MLISMVNNVERPMLYAIGTPKPIRNRKLRTNTRTA
jgi:hypothetical protein